MRAPQVSRERRIRRTWSCPLLVFSIFVLSEPADVLSCHGAALCGIASYLLCLRLGACVATYRRSWSSHSNRRFFFTLRAGFSFFLRILLVHWHLAVAREKELREPRDASSTVTLDAARGTERWLPRRPSTLPRPRTLPPASAMAGATPWSPLRRHTHKRRRRRSARTGGGAAPAAPPRGRPHTTPAGDSA